MGVRIASLFLVCQELDESVEFYRRIGLEVLSRKPRTAVLGTGESSGVNLHLHSELNEAEQAQYPVRWQAGSSGFVISLEVESLEAVLEAAPSSSLCVPPHRSAWGTRIMMLKDPDDYQLEFQESLPSLVAGA